MFLIDILNRHTQVAVWQPFQEARFFQTTRRLNRRVQQPEVFVQYFAGQRNLAARTHGYLISLPAFTYITRIQEHYYLFARKKTRFD